MSIATDLLPFFRAQWADRFTDSCVVKRATGTSFSDTTGQYTPTYTTNYTGPCLFRPMAPSETQFGQELVAVHGYSCFLPYTEADQLPGDLVDATSVTDPFLNGKQFTVKNIPADTYITKRELQCEEVVSG